MTPSSQTSQTPSALLIAGLVVLLLSAGCGPGDGQGLDQDGNIPTQSSGGATGGGPTGGNAPSGNQFATLAWVQDNVFVPECSGCHTGGAVFGVDWTASRICANVGRTSGEKSTLKEIESGDPDASYVIWKVQGAGPNGAAIATGTVRMPANGPPYLPDATIQNLRDWIADGVPGCGP